MFHLTQEKKSTCGGYSKIPDRIFGKLTEPFDFKPKFPFLRQMVNAAAAAAGTVRQHRVVAVCMQGLE